MRCRRLRLRSRLRARREASVDDAVVVVAAAAAAAEAGLCILTAPTTVLIPLGFLFLFALFWWLRFGAACAAVVGKRAFLELCGLIVEADDGVEDGVETAHAVVETTDIRNTKKKNKGACGL